MADFDNIHFGTVGNPLPEWRQYPFLDDDKDNDEDLPIDKDVENILGFDPDNEK